MAFVCIDFVWISYWFFVVLLTYCSAFPTCHCPSELPSLDDGMHLEKAAMAPIPSSPAWFHQEEGEARTVSPGQDVELDWGELLSRADCTKASFSGELSLHSAGSSMNEKFFLDTRDGKITLTQRANLFYREILVHIDRDHIGSYVDLNLGPYFRMDLQDARPDHMAALLQRIRFTVPYNLFSPCRPGPRVITAELQEQGSGQRTTAQMVINVIAPQTPFDMPTP